MSGGPITPERAVMLKNHWRAIRERWLASLATQPNYPEDRLSLLSQAERAFVQRCRLERAG